MFLTGIAAGLGIGLSARLSGPTTRAWYALRSRDPEFSREWDDALEESTDTVAAHLQDIAMRDSVTRETIKAAELLLRMRSRPMRTDMRPTAASVRLTEDTEGRRGIELRLSGGGARTPD